MALASLHSLAAEKNREIFKSPHALDGVDAVQLTAGAPISPEMTDYVMKVQINIGRMDSAQSLRLAAPHVHNVDVEIWRDDMGETRVELSQLNYQGKQVLTLTGWQFEQVAAKVAAQMAEYKREDAERAAWEALPEEERERITNATLAELEALGAE